jgi:hypothetical protein
LDTSWVSATRIADHQVWMVLARVQAGGDRPAPTHPAEPCCAAPQLERLPRPASTARRSRHRNDCRLWAGGRAEVDGQQPDRPLLSGIADRRLASITRLIESRVWQSHEHGSRQPGTMSASTATIRPPSKADQGHRPIGMAEVRARTSALSAAIPFPTERDGPVRRR